MMIPVFCVGCGNRIGWSTDEYSYDQYIYCDACKEENEE
jgi:DNA-directed RNA polymerase subunit N (RpoN/RPB10)